MTKAHNGVKRNVFTILGFQSVSERMKREAISKTVPQATIT